MSSATLVTDTKTTWEIDSSHSVVEFSVKHMMISRSKGTFSAFSGSILLDDLRFEDSTVELDIDAASIDTRDEKRDEHLRAADFFNVEQFPVMRFVSTAVHLIDEERFTLDGQLSIAGTTRPIEIAAKRTGSGINPWGMQVIGFEGDATVNRKDFDLNWNMALEAGGFLVGDDVTIHFDIEAIRQ
ncbi:YceI family protein [soil metagenome]